MNNIYNRIDKRINYLMDYYLDWQDYIERFSFPRIDYYYLINNISSFYTMLKLSKKYLKKWNNQNNNYFFYTLMCIPNKIEFNSSSYENILKIKKELMYNEKVFKFILEEDKDYKKTD
ncbi:MAG: hypothetical protein IJ097_03295 [Bacilli bacterium]|nr:hypothetical protein [Bacilli bacterium]